MNIAQGYAQISGSGVTVKNDTEYVVLYTAPVDGETRAPRWVEDMRVVARSAEAAIRVAIGDKIPDGAELFVAIPSRSWKPQTVKTKVETTLIVEDAT